ncbi:MAG: hypothetical protein CML01_21095 [Pseudomonas sp.]|nr:hypothetical protein [Pseudomonas sp.]|tara:strand:- start:6385 stop:6645 length:261 start_codon:yes stop_codon:yes gene_type:complete
MSRDKTSLIDAARLKSSVAARNSFLLSLGLEKATPWQPDATESTPPATAALAKGDRYAITARRDVSLLYGDKSKENQHFEMLYRIF